MSASDGSTIAHRNGGLGARRDGPGRTASGWAAVESSTAGLAVDVMRRSNRPPAHNANPSTSQMSTGAP